jgi:hypothetical protein
MPEGQGLTNRRRSAREFARRGRALARRLTQTPYRASQTRGRTPDSWEREELLNFDKGITCLDESEGCFEVFR